MDEPVVDVNLYVGHLNTFRRRCEPVALDGGALMLYDPTDSDQQTWMAAKWPCYLGEWA